MQLSTKRSNIDFSVPTRQSGVAILLILYKTVQVVFRQLVPGFIVIFLGESEKKSDQFFYLAMGIAGISLIISLVNYFRTYFLVSGTDLILHSGVIKHKKTTIPFTRIQSVNFEQNVVHQFFNVYKVKIDTAGSDKNEFEFHALDQHTAASLRDLVLTFKVPETDAPTSEEVKSMTAPHAETLLNLSETEVLKVGLTMNHLRSGGLIFLFFFWIYEQLSEIQPEQNLPDDWDMTLFENMSLVLFAIGIIFLASVVISVIRAFATYHNLKMDRIEGGFKVYSGLITRKEVSARDPKIQYVSWSDNPLRRMIRMYQLTLHQVISNELKSESKIQIPGCSFSKVQGILHFVFPETEVHQIQTNRVHRAYLYRFITIMGGVGATIATLLWVTAYTSAAFVVVIIALYAIISRLLSYKKIRFGFHKDIFYLKKGTFGNVFTLIDVRKVQSVSYTQSPYQKKRDLCTCTLHTAAGSLTIPYIPKDTAVSLLDFTLWRVETSKISWM
jgi:putative membrane protein